MASNVKIVVWNIMMQHTVGAYKNISSFMSESAAIEELENIASERPDEVVWKNSKHTAMQFGNNKHNCTRYKIEKSELNL